MQSEQKKRNISFSEIFFYLALALKHLRLMVLLFCLSLTAGLWYYVYAKPMYYARSLVRVDVIEHTVDAQTVFRDSNSRMVAQQLTAPHIINRTVRALGYKDSSDREIGSEIIRSVSIRYNSERNMEVSVYAYRPELVRVWTETLLREFQAYRAEQRAKYREGIIKSHTAEMAEITAKMEELLNSRHDFAAENERTKILVEVNQLKLLPKELAHVKNHLAEMERIRSLMAERKLDAVEILSVISSFEKAYSLDVGQTISEDSVSEKSPGASVVIVPAQLGGAEARPWEERELELRKLRQEREKMDKVYLPAHKKMVDITAKITGVESSLATDAEAALSRFNLEYANLLDKRGKLEAALTQFDQMQRKNDQYKQQYSQYEAGQLAWAKLYEVMARKMNTLDFAEDKERTYLQFLDHIDVYDDRPVSPNKLKLLIYSFFLGIALAIGVPFLLEFLDHTASSIEQIESSFDIRGLGIVPRIGNQDLQPLPLLTEESPDDRQLLENFRVIRTNLLLNHSATRNSQAIVVASAMPQEGKTVVSTNLALSFAQMGERTILIDADLRRGRLHRVFGNSSSPGLSEVFANGVPWRKACRPSGRENLDILCAGPHIAGATEAFGTEKFAQLMTELRKEYQRIIIDTPPVLGLSETSMMQPKVDGVLFVIWSGRTPLRNVKAATELLQANGARILGFVLNRLDLSAAPNYYHYYYYSYDYYNNYRQIEKT